MRSAPPMVPGMPREKREPRDARLLRGARDHGVENGGAGGDALLASSTDTSLKPRPRRMTTPVDAAVAHDQVRAGADDVNGNTARRVAQEVREIVFVLRHEQGLRRPADAEPGEFAERLIGEQPPAQIRQARFEVGGDVGEGHLNPAQPIPPAARRPIA